MGNTAFVSYLNSIDNFADLSLSISLPPPEFEPKLFTAPKH